MFFVVCVCVCVAASMACRILVPQPLQWNLRVLKAGPPGKSLLSFVVDIFSCSGKKTKWKRLKKTVVIVWLIMKLMFSVNFQIIQIIYGAENESFPVISSSRKRY